MSLRALALLAVAVVALAGCGAKAPTGTLKATDYKLAVGGSVNAVYQAFTGANPTGQVPTAGATTECAQNSVDPTVPVQHCKGPYSDFTAHATLPPAPDASPYKLYAVGPGFEYEAFTFQGKDGAYSGHGNATGKDLSAQVKEIQVRFMGVPLATAPGTAGNHTFSLDPALAALQVSGTFTGHHLEVTVTGLPANGTYMGKLYVADATSPTGYTAKEDFQVTNGKTVYDSKDHNIADFAQFHIHVGESMVNLYKASIDVPAKK